MDSFVVCPSSLHGDPHAQQLYSVDTSEQAHQLARQLNEQGSGHWQVFAAERPYMAHVASASVSVQATPKGMKRATVYHEAELAPLLDDALQAQIAAAGYCAWWSQERPSVWTDPVEESAAVQWLHVAAATRTRAERELRRIARARETELLECYEPVIGVVGIKPTRALQRLESAGPVREAI
jgi:hypothetical protein